MYKDEILIRKNPNRESTSTKETFNNIQYSMFYSPNSQKVHKTTQSQKYNRNQWTKYCHLEHIKKGED